MARLVLLQSNQGKSKDVTSTVTGHRAAPNEGEGVKQLLEANGFPCKRTTGGQFHFRCPFHEGPGDLGRKPTNFYVDAKSGLYYCQAASCGEKGNLVTLERFFGIDADPTLRSAYTTREDRLKVYEQQLLKDKREVFYDKGLTDTTIERFRIGFDQEKGIYVIPYLEGRRPVAFRFYDPTCTKGPNGSKYWWESGTEARLFNLGDAMGDSEQRVFICEGETKAMLMVQMGHAAVSVPGASIWKPEWSALFNHARSIYICMDNDNPEFHQHGPCHKCGIIEKGDCAGHNPGQEAAARLTDIFGYRAKNVVLPLPEGLRKVDINEYFMRDGHSGDDFAMLAFNLKQSPFVVRSLAQIMEDPPEEANFLIDGLLPIGGRLLVAGAPKTGKSILVENLALSIASGIPFLNNFHVEPSRPHRVLLLDRELSQRSLFDRLNALIESRPGYAAAIDNLYIDHTTLFKLDEPTALATLIGLIRANNTDVLILDTAYKFFSGDMESSKNVVKAFSVLDQAINETGVSVVLTHHKRKASNDRNGSSRGDSNNVFGSTFWVGWPNGTMMIDHLNRSVEDPFNTTVTFTDFRDCPPPEPLALYRDRESISYRSIVPYSHSEEDDANPWRPRNKEVLNYTSLANALLECTPVLEEDFLHMACGRFGARMDNVRLHLMDILDRHPDFKREGRGTAQHPYIWKYNFDKEEETFEEGVEQMEIS